MPIYDAAMLYKQDERPLVVIAGKEYGTGSSRTGRPRARPARRPGRHRRELRADPPVNLVGMGVLPLQFRDGESAESLGPDRQGEIYDHRGRRESSRDRMSRFEVTPDEGDEFSFAARCRIDTYNELEYFKSGGILHYVLRRLAALSGPLAGFLPLRRASLDPAAAPARPGILGCQIAYGPPSFRWRLLLPTSSDRWCSTRAWRWLVRGDAHAAAAWLH